ncbi:MAG: hypothetical protein EPO21_19725 [Chloroflexota bacterium]|nr:MAG: hypothetical protein EPO21_19725 [Chloroflexota bacterium]
MALMAIAVPILPGKTEQWKRFVDELNGPRRAEFEESRCCLGVHERAFLQTSPHGDMVIVTLEGPNPEEAFRQFGTGTDDFTRWFVQQVKEIHGMDLSQPALWSMPTLEVDSAQKIEKKAA